jgi:hypothetical protein
MVDAVRMEEDNMMPTPKHLESILVRDDAKVDETDLSGKLKCTCGSETFSLRYPGKTQGWLNKTPCTIEIDGKFFFLVKTVCNTCKTEHLIIDQDVHGWNGVICRDEEQRGLPRPPLVDWKCSCGSVEHKARITIMTQGKTDFVEEAGDEFDENLWPEAFSSLSMDITCAKCGKQNKTWIDVETM